MADPTPQAQRSYLDKLQAYWDHPDPQGMVAMVKAALGGVVDAVNGANADAGPYPSTEEEAFRYNQARDRGIAGAWNAASAFGPSVPTGTGGLLARAFEGAARSGFPSRSTSETPPAGGLVRLLHQEMDRQGIPQTLQSSQPPRASGWVPFVPPPGQGSNGNEMPKWNPGWPYAAWPEWSPQRLPTGEIASVPPIRWQSSETSANGVGSPGQTKQATFSPMNPVPTAPEVPHLNANDGEDWDRRDPVIEILRRCIRAANRNNDAWQDFCDDLPPDARELHAVCNWNLNQSKAVKEGFCRSRFIPSGAS